MAKRSEAQKRASLENNCLRTVEALQRAFQMAGHYDFQQFAHELEEQFRAKLSINNRTEK